MEDDKAKDWQHWTPSAIHCYKIKGKCDGCYIQDLMEQKCMMYLAVASLYAKFGPPPRGGKG